MLSTAEKVFDKTAMFIKELKIKIKIKIAAVKCLKKELSFGELSALLPELNKMKRANEPWKDLPKAQTEKDEKSRDLIGEAILLYRILLEKHDAEDAEKIVRKVIIDSAIAQLRCLIPKLKVAELIKLSESERKAKFCKIVDGFPNTDWKLQVSSDTQYVFLMTRCRLCELVRQVGHPELANAFCAADEMYFRLYQDEILFERPQTIAEGCNCCEFRFSIRNMGKESCESKR